MLGIPQNFYSSAIDVRPLLSQTQYLAHQNRFKGAQPGGMGSQMLTRGVTPGQMSAFNSLLGRNFQPERQRQMLGWERDYALANTAHLLNAEQARAQSGIQGYQTLQRSGAQDQQHQQQMSNLLLSLLSGMM